VTVEERHGERGAETGALRPRWLWLAALAALVVLRSALGAAIPGFLTGDDVEILEQGFRRVFGLEVAVWEIRNTLLADLLVAPALTIAAVSGVEAPRWLCQAATAPFTLLSAVSVALLGRIVLAWSRDRAVAALAALLFALHWMPFGYAGTVYPRTASTTCVLGALALITLRPSAARSFGAGALAALAFAFRYSEAVFLPVVLAAALAPRAGEEGSSARWRRAAAVVAGFAVGTAVFVGYHDLRVWGRPFASLAEFAHYTLVERRASSFESDQSWYWYLRRLPRWLDPAALVLVIVAIRRRALPMAWVAAGIPLVSLSIVHHKQLRYLQGVVPFVCALAAAGALHLWRSGRRRTAAALALASLLLSLAPLRFLTRKSAPAVAAATAMASDPGVRVVALEQAWAHGGRIFLGPRIEPRDLGYSPTASGLERAIDGTDRVALYARSLSGDPVLGSILVRRGFREESRYPGPPGRTVVVFERCPRPAGESELSVRCSLQTLGEDPVAALPPEAPCP
jgi:hypothetical protein